MENKSALVEVYDKFEEIDRMLWDMHSTVNIYGSDSLKKRFDKFISSAGKIKVAIYEELHNGE